MPPDTESDEELKAVKLSLKAQGNVQTHTKSQTGKHKCMQKSEWAHVQSGRNVQYTHEHTNRKHKSRWMRSLSGTPKHTHRCWQSIKNIANLGPTETQTCWYSLAEKHAAHIKNKKNYGVRNKPFTESIFLLFRSYLIFIYPYVTMGLTSLL